MKDYKSMIQDYASKLSPNRQADFYVSVKQLKQQHQRSNQWIYLALTQKEPSVWEQYGFGLMFKSNFIYYIDRAVEQEAAKATLKDGNYASSLSLLLDD